MIRKMLLQTFAFVTITTVVAYAQPQPGMGPGMGLGMGPQMEQRFQMMDRLMEDARKAQGEERYKDLRQHMQVMQDQMRIMRPMMGGMRPPVQRGPGTGEAPGMEQLQERMDMMQRMMEQMLQHQNMMLDRVK